jgi:hypothetical protein
MFLFSDSSLGHQRAMFLNEDKSFSVKDDVFIQLIRKSRSHSTHMKKPFSFNSHEKAVSIQPSRKRRSHSTHMKKPFPFNPGEKKPFLFNSFEKAVPIQPSRKSRWMNQLRTYLFG